MVKKVQKETPASSQAKTIRLPTAGSLSSLMKQSLNYDSQISKPTESRSELMTDYKTNKHVDPPAFNIVKAMFKLSDEKLSVRLAHLLHYIEFAKDPQGRTLHEHATAQGKMFDERGEVDQDGETDMRPRHLRQPGASGADIDEAERAAGAEPANKLN